MSFIRRFFQNYFIRRIVNKERNVYRRAFETNYKNNKSFDLKQPLSEKIETQWLDTFRKLDPKVNIASLRVYSHYIDNYNHIIPRESCQIYILPVLNMFRFDSFYSDKNNLDIILPPNYTPSTILRKINGVYKNSDYKTIPNLTINSIFNLFDGYEQLIIKPSYNSLGGKSVTKIKKKDGKWYADKKEINIDFFNNFNANFIIQDCLEQSENISKFCNTSVNTIRVVTYRSVVDDEVCILASVFRIGHDGSNTDNLSSGGKAARINVDGTLNNELFDANGNISYDINGLDFKVNRYEIVNFNGIIEFAKNVANKFPYHRLLALDIAIDKDDNPCLVEVNLNDFAIWVPYFAHFDLFGDRTQEVLDFVMKHQNTENIHENIAMHRYL